MFLVNSSLLRFFFVIVEMILVLGTCMSTVLREGGQFCSRSDGFSVPILSVCVCCTDNGHASISEQSRET